MSKKVRFSYKKERSLLSDVLPFEIPISFSNRHFYKFVLRHRISVENKAIIWLKGPAVLDKIVMLLLALPENSNRLRSEYRYVGEEMKEFRRYALESGGNPKPEKFMIPFVFKVRHKETAFRDLCIPHPKSQLLVVELYDRCKEIILYYTSLSPFSIRSPARLSKFRENRTSIDFANTVVAEKSDRGYENLMSFFVNEDYSNIYKFYESYRFHRAEKKYDKLIKLDISKCFDSIYTHSIGWAVIGKETQKESLPQAKGTFPDRFDRLMQHMNQGETNGIVIGPEFSRIYAEIILQAVDREVSSELQKGQNPLLYGRDYEIFRYIDDYFIFVNFDSDSTRIIDKLQHTLREYKLYLNTAKSMNYEKPIITEITMAKQQIAQLLEDSIKFSLKDEDENNDGEVITRGSIYVNSNALITNFKTILKTYNVEYKDILNYALAIVERKCARVIENYLECCPNFRTKAQLVNAINSILEFTFFTYSVSPRVNTTVRVCRVLCLVTSFIAKNGFSPDQVQTVHKQIFDNICFVLKKFKSTEETQVETLYLLVALSELGPDYWLEESVLRKYLGIEPFSCKSSGPSGSLSYFTITVCLFYMKNKVRYNTLRDHIINCALEKFRRKSETRHKDAELGFLLFDLISCPFVPEDKKCKALEMFGVTDEVLANEIINFTDSANRPQQWFTSWVDFNFGKELDAKRSQEVY